MLSAAELERYARHIVLKEIGGAGQQKLKDAKVLVIGAGGLGSPVLQYLAAAGIGQLGIIDDDVVSLSNLQRQVLHDTDQLGEPKVASAAEAIARLNPNVSVKPHPTRLNGQNVMALVSNYDLVIDCCDNFETRYLASDACFFAQKPLITAAIGRFDGSLTLLKPYLTNEVGTPYPTYRCVFPNKPAAGSVPTCEEAGVVGALAGVLGSLQAMEAIKEIAGFGETLLGRLLLVDTATMRFESIRYSRDPSNPLNGDAPKSWPEILELDS
ncbi:HesA/MoeB/ThiF family protein [Pseudovibrio exalbescens]|uniref:Molybdopterin-synthase adenylyltransferase n=1 Tax=Pseudovibrio exalbescens TaxID=197461 RepID=A0A1U7JIK5_9HYPH|nr:molybdopterin-synthase adenylyltransferase MoeB [Pseudovibrio exalbescens]OKL44559.1 adenylyltransferase [Pseudovibrio exalbescens]